MSGDKKKAKDSERLNSLNTALQGVENDLLHRALERSRDEVDHAFDFINKAAEAGAITVEPGEGE